MAHSVIELVLEAGALRALQLEDDGGRQVRGDAVCWSFTPEPASAADAEPPAEGGAAESLPAPAPDAGEDVGDEPDALAGAFAEAAAHFRAREVALALPLDRLLVKVFKFPAESRDDLADLVAEELAKYSPLPDEELRVGWEVLRETEHHVYVAAAALTESVAAPIGAALAAAKLRVTRTDASLFGWMRALWPDICSKAGVARRLVLSRLGGGWEILVLDDDAPSAVRGVGAGPAVNLRREVMLSLMEADAVAGAREAGDVVLALPADAAIDVAAVEAELAAFGPVRRIAPDDEFAGVEGSAFRAVEGAALDVTPEDWRAALQESRFKRRLCLSLAVAFGVWLVAVAAGLGGLFAVDRMTVHQKTLSKRHQKAYQSVDAMKKRVELVQKYSDRDRSALELLKAVSDRLPEGVTLSGFNYKRDEGVRVSGESDEPTFVYELKNALVKCGAFGPVKLTGPSQSRGVYKFDVDAPFQKEDEE